MKIDEKIQEMQSELIKVLTENSSQSKEDVVLTLERMGIKRETAIKLVEAYIKAEEAKNASKNIWMSEATIDSTDVAEYQQKELETRQKFDAIIEASSILVIVNRINLNEINEELWQKLYDQGIDASQITSPILRKDFSSYVERIENENNPETQKMKELLSRVGKHAVNLKKKFLELEKENEQLKAENERLKRENEALRSSYNYMENKFKTRIASDEKHYQSALEQIKRQKREIRNLQNRGVFQTIGAKLFGNREKGLPESSLEIPSTLYESISEQISATAYVQEHLPPDKQAVQTTTVERTEDEEIQQ